MKTLLLPSLLLLTGLATAAAVDPDAARPADEQAAARQERADLEALERTRACYGALLPGQPEFVVPAPAHPRDVYALSGSAPRPIFHVIRRAAHEGAVAGGWRLLDAAEDRRDALAAFTADIDGRLARLREQGAETPPACQAPRPRARRVTSGGRDGGQAARSMEEAVGGSKALREARSTPSGE
jgi:hypothetical protein